MMTGIFLIARQFIPWYLGDGFLPSAYAMMILAPIILFTSLSEISGIQYFTATNQIHVLIKSNVSALTVNIAVNAALIPAYGYAGAAVATVLSSLVAVCIQYYHLTRQMNVRPLLKSGLNYLAASSVMAVMICFPTRRMEAAPFTTFLQVLTGVTVYGLILWTAKDEMLMELLSTAAKKIRKGKGD